MNGNIISVMSLGYIVALLIQIIILVLFLRYIKEKRNIVTIASIIIIFIISLTTLSFFANWNISSGSEAFKKKQYKLAINYLDRAMIAVNNFEFVNFIPGFFISKKAAILSIQGISNYKLNNYDEAIGYLSKSLSINPSQFVSRVYLAHSLFTNGKYNEAEVEYNKVINEKEYSYDFFRLYHTGLSYYNLRKYNDAIKMFEKALELDPKRKDIHLQIAGCYSLQNKIEKSIEHLWLLKNYDERFIEIIKNDPTFNNIKLHPEYISILQKAG